MDSSASRAADAGITERHRNFPCRWLAETRAHGHTGGGQTQERTCQGEGGVQSRNSIQATWNSMLRSTSARKERSSLNAVREIQQGRQVGKSEEWQAGAPRGLPARHRLSLMGDRKPRRVTHSPPPEKEQEPVPTARGMAHSEAGRDRDRADSEAGKHF